MNFSKEHIDELIGKYLSGEATPEEAIFLDEWRMQDPENARHFAQLEKLFHAASGENQPNDFNTDAAWERVQSRIGGQKESGKIISMNPFVMRVAASVTILVTLGAAMFFLLQPSVVHVNLASTDQILTDTLPQGDILHLNKESSIQYAFNPKQNEAKIELVGEAFFDLRNPEQTTIVQTGSIMIRDIGTKFNVQSRSHLDTILVVVQEGEVQLYSETNEGISVKAGEEGRFIRSAQRFEKSPTVSSNYLSWKTRSFHFNNATLKEVVSTLNAVFEARFVVEQPVENCRITVRFHNEEPGQIAEIIAETLGLLVSDENGVISFKGSGCAQ